MGYLGEHRAHWREGRAKRSRDYVPRHARPRADQPADQPAEEALAVAAASWRDLGTNLWATIG